MSKTHFTCVIIDDEPLAQSLIEKYIQRVNYLQLLTKFDNAIDAIEGVDELKPDIIFLDINMPEMSGVEFIRTFTKNRPYIIMTTAYSQYAIDGYEHDVVDYLLKPIAFDRFLKAINKIRDKHDTLETKLQKSQSEEEKPALTQEEIWENRSIEGNFFWVKEDKKLVKINVDEVLYVEGMKDYIKIFLTNQMIITHMTMTKIDQMLAPFKKFIRINRSFVVKISRIKAIDGNMIELTNNKKLAIGINYRNEIKNSMKNKMM